MQAGAGPCSDPCTHSPESRRPPPLPLALSPEMKDGSSLSWRDQIRTRTQSRLHHLLLNVILNTCLPPSTSVFLSLKWD